MPWPRVIFFDAGGTLLAPHPSVGHVYAEVAGEFGLECDPAETQWAFERAFERVRDRTLSERSHLFGFDPAAAWALWREVLGETFDLLGGRPAPFDQLFDRLYEEFAQARRYTLIDGAAETLETLRQRGHHLGLISNWDHRLRGILRGLGLDQRLDPIVVSCEAKAEKPDPAIFHIALQAAGVAAVEALMVGDSPETDIAGANAAGLRAVLLDPRESSRLAEPRIARLADLPHWIEEMFTNRDQMSDDS